MKQLPFEWYQRRDEVSMGEIVLEPTTIRIVITLMATALIVVVRGVAPVQEATDDER